MSGMSWRTGPTLGDRAGLPARPATGLHGARHCWVRDMAYSQALPGLLLRWEQTGDTWWALVVYAVPLRDGLIHRWVMAADLRPV